jgi:hypothetical protein
MYANRKASDAIIGQSAIVVMNCDVPRAIRFRPLPMNDCRRTRTMSLFIAVREFDEPCNKMKAIMSSCFYCLDCVAQYCHQLLPASPPPSNVDYINVWTLSFLLLALLLQGTRLTGNDAAENLMKCFSLHVDVINWILCTCAVYNNYIAERVRELPLKKRTE